MERRLMRRFTLMLSVLAAVACSNSAPQGPSGDAPSDAAADILEPPDAAPDSAADAAPEVGDDLPAGELPPPPDIGPLLDEARFWLAHGEPKMALDLFEEALALSPDDPDAVFGAGLAQYIHAAEFLAMVSNMPAQFLGYASGEGTRDPESMNEAMAEQVAGVFADLNERFARAEALLSRIDDPDFEWSIDRAPLYYVARPMLMYRGRFDLGDVSLIRAVNGFCWWFTALMGAQDLATDFSYAMVIAQKVQGGGADPMMILEAAAYLLGTSPHFLGVNDSGGEELFYDGVLVMRDVGQHVLDAVAWLEDEEATEQDVTRLEWEGGERILVLHNRVTLDGYEGTEEPLRVRLTDDVLEATAALVAALDEPGTVVPFSRGPGLQLATILGLAAKLGIVDQMGISLPVDITHLEIDQIHTLLAGFLPDALGFDWAGFHQVPAGLRALLPLLRDPDDGSWLLSWECPDDLWHDGFPSGPGGLLCGDKELVDGPHFPGTPWEMDANGHVTKLPYLVWQDPTLSGLVSVDAAYLDGGAPDWQAPDNTGMNTGLHLWLDAIMGFL
jgi:hypothetical protein